MKKVCFLIYLRKTMILYKTDYYLYTALVVKSPSFLEEKFIVLINREVLLKIFIVAS